MRDAELLQRADSIAGNRTAGASELLGELLPLLEQALPAGPETVLGIARIVCAGQPAMAPLWNACAVAAAEDGAQGRFARLSAEFTRASRALIRAAGVAVADAVSAPGVADAAGRHSGGRSNIVTLSYSRSVCSTLAALASSRPLYVTCGISLPGGEGQHTHDVLAAAGASVDLVDDATLATYLDPAALVLVGADAISARDFTNKVGTFGLAAVASYTGTAVYVVASRDKVQSPTLAHRVVVPRLFERIPIALVTLFLTESGVTPPSAMADLSARFEADIQALIARL